jgi:hypothetical protein
MGFIIWVYGNYMGTTWVKMIVVSYCPSYGGKMGILRDLVGFDG